MNAVDLWAAGAATALGYMFGAVVLVAVLRTIPIAGRFGFGLILVSFGGCTAIAYAVLRDSAAPAVQQRFEYTLRHVTIDWTWPLSILFAAVAIITVLAAAQKLRSRRLLDTNKRMEVQDMRGSRPSLAAPHTLRALPSPKK